MRFTVLAVLMLMASHAHAQKSWKTFKSEKGAFTADFPAEPTVTSVKRTTPEGFEVRVNLHMVSADNEVAYVIYNEFEPGMTILDETVYLNEVARETLTRLNQDTSNVESILFEGYPGRRFASSMKDGVTELKVILRTNRAYIIAGYFPHKKKSSLTKFMNSFRFLPHKQPQWLTHHSAQYLFRADFPMEPKQETQEQYGSTMEVFYGRDDNSGNNYSVAIEEYSPYDYYESDSAVLATRANAYSEGEDSVLLERDVTVDGRPARELILKQGENHFQMRVLTFARGTYGYTLFAFLSPAEIQGEAANHFFTSFRFAGAARGNLLTDKKALLMKDIASTATAVWKPANAAFAGYEFAEEDVAGIQALIKQAYSDDADSVGSRKEVMLEVLREIGSEKSIPFIESIFPKLNAPHQVAALQVLANIKSRQSLMLLSKLLPKHKPLTDRTWRYYYLFSSFRLDSASQKDYLLSILKLTSEPAYQEGIYMLTEQLMKDKRVTLKDLTPYRPQILKDFNAAAQTFLKDSTYGSLEHLIEIIGYGEATPHEIAVLQKISQRTENEYLATKAVTALWRLKQKPENRVVEYLAANLSSRQGFWIALDDYSLGQNFPKKYARQDSLAVSEFYNYILEDYEEIGKVEIVHRSERDYEDGHGVFYVVKFYSPYDEAWYLGVCGPYEKDTLNHYGDYTGSDFAEATDTDYDAYLTRYLTE